MPFVHYAQLGDPSPSPPPGWEELQLEKLESLRHEANAATARVRDAEAKLKMEWYEGNAENLNRLHQAVNGLAIDMDDCDLMNDPRTLKRLVHAKGYEKLLTMLRVLAGESDYHFSMGCNYWRTPLPGSTRRWIDACVRDQEAKHPSKPEMPPNARRVKDCTDCGARMFVMPEHGYFDRLCSECRKAARALAGEGDK